MTILQKLKAPLRYATATVLAALSGALAASLPSVRLIGSPSVRPGAWFDHVLAGTILGLPAAVVAVLPLCLVVRWIMWRRRLRGPVAAATAGGGMAAMTVVGLALPVSMFDPEHRYFWSNFMPPILCLAGFALTWPMFLDRLAPAEARPTAPDLDADRIRDADRAVRTATETLAAAITLVPILVVGFFGSFVVGLGAGEDWSVVESFTSANGLNRAYVVNRNWGGAVGGIDTQVYVLPTAREWTENDRGLLLWSGDHIDTTQVVWDSDRALRVQARPEAGASLAEYSQGWSRSGFSVRTEPLH